MELYTYYNDKILVAYVMISDNTIVCAKKDNNTYEFTIFNSKSSHNGYILHTSVIKRYISDIFDLYSIDNTEYRVMKILYILALNYDSFVRSNSPCIKELHSKVFTQNWWYKDIDKLYDLVKKEYHIKNK